MILKSLRLLSFRAHAESRVTFAPKVNLIHGPNGAGKTNLLEAIHYLCLTKSFIASRDGYVLRQGCPYFEVEGTFEGERRPELRVRLVYVPGEGKRIFVNGAPMERLADIVGMLPVVVVSPEDQALTAEGPSERRKFLNNIMSQARPVYLDDVLKYKRAVKQRNALLSEVKKKPRSVDPSVMASWDAELVALGSRVVAARHRFLKEFDTFLMEAYALIEDVAEKPSIEYDTIVDLPDAVDEAAVAELYRDELDRVARRERERGLTLIGPHRDELVFRLNDLEVRRYASQGQHRTFGMALKLAKYFYLREQAGELPLLLLDDVFDTLDARRTRAFLDLLETDEVGQSLITAAQRALLDGVLSFEAPGNQTVYVEGGTVHAESAAEM
ncbi:MAG: DNA replication and repair protein RecF [Bacteroidetes bacterium]|jgi:DNA replication and repair protein RecF|nr:DNA replication and repair protein RecF [Bacteroidota bacterium]